MTQHNCDYGHKIKVKAVSTIIGHVYKNGERIEFYRFVCKEHEQSFKQEVVNLQGAYASYGIISSWDLRVLSYKCILGVYKISDALLSSLRAAIQSSAKIKDSYTSDKEAQ